MYTDILLPVDLGNESSWAKALPAAIEYCEAFGSNLHVMTVMPDFRSPMVAQFFPDDHEDKLMDNAKDVLHKFVADRVPEEIKVQHIVADGTIYKAIIETADDIGADLIIMGSHRPELQDYLLGPNAARVVRHSQKSVLVVR
ncbi:MAG: universal stress protein [Rhodospirillaceae bacterium TMED63]|nr:universal stress protein UspA [Rhodospirillaceae bacterium]RPF99801.1 MAG: universal stress protein [Rhodospirillaceae bacterium TMED63]